MSNTDALKQSESISQEHSEHYSLPCSVVQRTCYFFDRANPGHPSNNIAVRFLLQGELHQDCLLKALTDIVRRHEILRTRFLMHGGEPRQITETKPRFDMRFVDLEGAPREEAERLSIEEATAGFDLRQGPLFRGQLLRLAPQEHMLLLTLHHIVADGWSVGIITHELGELYRFHLTGQEATLPDLEIQYADYACWQNEWIADGSLEAELTFWRGKLDGFAPLAIQTDFPRPIDPSGEGEIHSRLLPKPLTSQLKELAEREGCTFFMAMYAALLAMLHKETGQTELVLKTPAAGRDKTEIEPLIGWFVNPLIVRLSLEPHASFRKLLHQSQEAILEAFAHQDAPFEKVMEVIKPKVMSDRRPPLPVNFILQRDFVRPWDSAGLKLTAIPSKSVGVFVDLNFFLVEREDGWRVSVDIARELFRPETAQGFLEAFQVTLEAFARNPDQSIATLSLAGLREKSTAAPVVRAETRSAFRAPANETEAKIIRLWSAVLGEEEISADANFFDLGGHSILATKLIAKLQEEFGQEIELRQIFADPTPAAMAKLVVSKDTSAVQTGILEIQKGSSQQAFFLIDGDHWFRPFAQLCGADLTFHGIPLRQFPSFAGEAQRKEIAKQVAALMLSRHPHQEFVLGGWCDAGVTAFSIAESLVQAGAKVKLLVLFDSMEPDYWHSLQSMVASTSHQINRLGARFQAIPEKGVFSALGSAAKDVGEGVGRGLRRIPKLFWQRTNDHELPYPVLLLRPSMHGVGDPSLGWRRVCAKGLEVVEVPGEHSSIFHAPHVNEMARLFRQALNRYA